MSTGSVHAHPAWYGAVMGTGAVALVLASQGAAWGGAAWDWAAVAFLLVASVLGLLLLPRYARRLGDRGELRDEVAHPGHGAMLATVPAGLLVLAVGWGRVGPELVPTGVALWVSGILLVVGAVGALVTGVAWSSVMLHASPGLENVNGGWLIPPVMNLLVPLALTPLIAANPGAAGLLLTVGFAFFGIGLVLFLVVLTLLVARLAMAGPMPSALAPSLWIPLAPAGILGIALLRLLQSGRAAGIESLSAVGAGVAVLAMGLGFGLWWAAFAVVELRRLRRAGAVPIHPGWWGFVFPVGAMTLAVSALAVELDSIALRVISLVAAVGLVLLWAYVAVVTLRLVVRHARPSDDAALP